LQGFRSKMGRPFAAMIRLNDEHMPEFDFGQGSSGEGEGEEIDFSGQEPLGTCPKCAARVFEHGMAYVCEKAVGAAKTCDFRSGKIILQQPVERAQMTRLLATGRTELLKNFVSSRTKRKFSAYLVRGSDGKVGFEFEARKPKAGAKIAEKEAPAKTPRTAAKPAKAPARTAAKAPARTAAKTAAKKKATKKAA
jgi:DNA topoisomerase-3